MNSDIDADDVQVEEFTEISLFGGFKANANKPKYSLP